MAQTRRDAAHPSFRARLAMLAPIPANAAGAIAVYLFFSLIDPLEGSPLGGSAAGLALFAGVTGALLAVAAVLSDRWTAGVRRWARALRSGAAPDVVPTAVRRRVLNAALMNGTLSLGAWFAAGLFYLLLLRFGYGLAWREPLRIFLAIVLVGGPVASALAFLVSEYHWRREIPLFFPDGRLERRGVLRVPIQIRLLVTFLLTSILPLLMMVVLDLRLEERFPERTAAWRDLVRADLYLVAITVVASSTMALLVARFINRPVQALRAGMARVAASDLTIRVPVRSTDELGELNAHFNAMVEQLRLAGRAQEVFGRYVSPAVAREALGRRGGALDSTVVCATAMFADLRGFTAVAQSAPVQDVVRLLNVFYATVERVCEREEGVITQFLGDGVVVVFGGPLRPAEDHARRAVRAAISLQWSLVNHPPLAGIGRLQAGIGICTGDMVAGHIRANERVVYTIVGDAVNQAARLQVKTRDVGASILVTASTRAALRDADGFCVRPVGAMPLRGIAAPVEVFAVEV
jgi:class 3 adenylate cyclase